MNITLHGNTTTVGAQIHYSNGAYIVFLCASKWFEKKNSDAIVKLLTEMPIIRRSENATDLVELREGSLLLLLNLLVTLLDRSRLFLVHLPLGRLQRVSLKFKEGLHLERGDRGR